MIAQLIGSGVGEITAVSVRYFGGIKLGTGGLVKAYGNGVQQALKLLGTEYKVPQKLYQLRCEYSHISMVEQLLQQFSGQVIASDYAENVTLQISLPATLVGEIGDKLRDLSRGVLSLTPKS